MSQSIRRPFRFAVVTAQVSSAQEWVSIARRVESTGYTTLLMPDAPAGPVLSPLPALAVAAASTTTLRLGTWVLANNLHNPVLLARESATLDLLSGGRFELGLGTGRPDNDYASVGLSMESGGERVRRLGESVRIINALFRGESVTVSGSHYSISGATLFPTPLRRLPMLLAASGKRAIELAGEQANIVAMGAHFGSQLSEQVEWLKAGAGERFSSIELSTL
ncbi:MAG: LLM class flavin-dependent oxidoreductase, partial [Candidatus Dormibacteraceae bacterium]